MRDAVPILLAVLLAFALPATVAVAGTSASGFGDGDAAGQLETTDTDRATLQEQDASGGLVQVEGTPNRLVLDGDGRTAYVRTGPDLGTAMTLADDGLRESFGTYHFEERYDNWTNAERQMAIDAEIERIDERIGELKARERRAVAAHADGNITDRHLLQTLVRVSERANAMHDRLGAFEDREDELLGYTVHVSSMQAQLDTLRSPIRSRILADARDPAAGEHTIAIQTTDDGLSLAIANGAEYARETIRYENRNTSLEDQFAEEGPHDYVEEIYPWAYENVIDSRSTPEYPDIQLYEIDFPHEQGSLHAFLDGGTGTIYYELQQLRLSQIPKQPLEGTWTNGSVELAINETPVNGPVEVAVTDRSSGDPIDATIHLNETAVARTDGTGTAWVIPPGEEYVVSARTDEGVVNATVSNRP